MYLNGFQWDAWPDQSVFQWISFPWASKAVRRGEFFWYASHTAVEYAV